MRVRRTGTILVLAVLLAGCGDGDGAAQDDPTETELPPGELWMVDAEWDLRTTSDITAIGWPEEIELSAYEIRADRGLERVLLPGGLVVEGFDRANPSRRGGVAGSPLSDDLDALTVAYTDRTVAEVRDLAVALAGQVELDPAGADAWADRNADGPDRSSGGAQETIATAELGEGVTFGLELRAFDRDVASLFATVSWPDPRTG